MKRNFAAVLVFIVISVFGKSLMASDNLILAGDDLAFPVFCAQYQGIGYDFVLRYAPEADPGRLFWKMDVETFKIAQNGCPPLPVKDDFSFGVAASFQDVVYGFVLRYTPNQADPAGLYWKMDVNTFKILDSTENLRSDMESTYRDGNPDLYDERTSADFLSDGVSYGCHTALEQQYIENYSFENAACVIHSVSYRNESGKVFADLSRTLSYTAREKANPSNVSNFSSAENICCIFEDGRWRNYGNRQGDPGPSASEILTCESVDAKWEPVGVKNAFTGADQQVTVFVNFLNIHNGSSVNFRWYRPDGTLQLDYRDTIEGPETSPACISENAEWSSGYPIRGYENWWKNNAGTWRVEVYADNAKAGEVFFTYTP